MNIRNSLVTTSRYVMLSKPTLAGRQVSYELKIPIAVLAEIRRRVLDAGAARRAAFTT